MEMDTMKNRKSLMKSIIILSLLVVFMSGCSSHKSVASLGDAVIYSNNSVTTKAEFPGGSKEFGAYIRLYLQTYRRPDTPNFGEGQGVYSFVIDQEGNIRDVKVHRKISPQKDIAMINLLEKMPKWKPATLDGNPVCVRITFFRNYSKNPSSYEIGPYFPGGTEALDNYLTGYSEGVEGTQEVDIIIDEEGNVIEAEIARSGIGGFDVCNQALSIVKGMPKWIPAKKNGKPVPAKKRVSVYFSGY